MTLFKRGDIYWYDFQVNGVRVRESTRLQKKSEAPQADALRKAVLVQDIQS